MDKKQIESLLVERIGYVRRNLPKRVASVDQALANLGHIIESATAEPQAERASKPAVQKRIADKK